MSVYFCIFQMIVIDFSIFGSFSIPARDFMLLIWIWNDWWMEDSNRLKIFFKYFLKLLIWRLLQNGKSIKFLEFHNPIFRSLPVQIILSSKDNTYLNVLEGSKNNSINQKSFTITPNFSINVKLYYRKLNMKFWDVQKYEEKFCRTYFKSYTIFPL